jgi:hypothetical protein
MNSNRCRTIVTRAFQAGNIPSGYTLQLEIYATTAGVPTGSALFTSNNSYDPSKISKSTSGQNLYWTFDTIALSNSTTYAMVYKSSYPVSSTNYIYPCTGGGNPYANGSIYAYDGSSWSVVGTDDWYFEINGEWIYDLGGNGIAEYTDYTQMGTIVHNMEGVMKYDSSASLIRHISRRIVDQSNAAFIPVAGHIFGSNISIGSGSTQSVVTTPAILGYDSGKYQKGMVITSNYGTDECARKDILTDPSYQGQIVAMTASHVGNYGINPEDVESRKIFLSGFVVQEQSAIYSSWRSTQTLHDYLAQSKTPGLWGVDTRSLTRYLRTRGAVNGIIASAGTNLKLLIKKAKSVSKLESADLTETVTSSNSYSWGKGTVHVLSAFQPAHKIDTESKKKNVVVMDFGVKENILRCLVDLNCDVTVVPSHASSEEILSKNPDGILLSNGPGDPAMDLSARSPY